MRFRGRWRLLTDGSVFFIVLQGPLAWIFDFLRLWAVVAAHTIEKREIIFKNQFTTFSSVIQHFAFKQV